ncbi:hypothetical protein CN553_28760 [Bacillus cereus]|uniref:Chitin-binding type-3 domain-containing protein n=1 Tax=Bacillus cereus TaxID=1396 RepID=A0A9X6U669_BACCE|nr:hypothetical protein [Bacillus cereus]PEN82387.1 hypothetical protein CN553_28760 [Bacillus cereus]
MKNKKQQWIKGIMLATVLGLGWGVAGDISHAAGTESSQIQGIAAWNEESEYGKGDKVVYNETEYELMWGNVKLQDKKDENGKVSLSPDNHIQWKTIGGKLPEWNADRGYLEGHKVSYNGTEYQATKLITGGTKPADEKGNPATGWKELAAKLFMHEGQLYKVMYSNTADDSTSYWKLKNDNGKAKWVLVNLDNQELYDILAEKEGKGVIASQAKNEPVSTLFMHGNKLYKTKNSNGSKFYLELALGKNSVAWTVVDPKNKAENDILAGEEKEGVIFQTGM